MDDQTALGLVAAYAGLFTFLLLVLIENQRRHVDEFIDSPAGDHHAAFLRQLVSLQWLVVFCSVGILLCVGWLASAALGVPAITIPKLRATLGLLVLSLYVFVLVLAYAAIQLGVLYQLRRAKNRHP
jgi:hypothetical protein